MKCLWFCHLEANDSRQSLADSHINWIIGEGKINFWADRWLEGIRTAEIIFPPPALAQFSVRQVLPNENNASIQCHEVVPLPFMIKVKAWAARLNATPDCCIWSATSKGSFSLKSAWSICRQKSNVTLSGKMLWSKFVPLKWSLIVWRAIRGRLPFDRVLQKMGFHLASKCLYC